jgi:hypothetical protein
MLLLLAVLVDGMPGPIGSSPGFRRHVHRTGAAGE